MMEIKRLFLLILEILVFIAQCFIIIHYLILYTSKYNFKDFMKEIESSSGSEDCKIAFRYLFGNYTLLGNILQKIEIGFVIFTYISVELIWISGVMVNIISLYQNVKVLLSNVITFIYPIIVAIYSFIQNNFYEEDDLNRNISKVRGCGSGISTSDNISLLEKRLSIMKIYSSILLGVSIVHLLSTILIIRIVLKSLALNPREELVNPEPNSDNDKNEDKNEENTNLKV